MFQMKAHNPVLRLTSKKRARGSRDNKEFKVMIIKMLRRKLDEHSENFHKEKIKRN